MLDDAFRPLVLPPAVRSAMESSGGAPGNVNVAGPSQGSANKPEYYVTPHPSGVANAPQPKAIQTPEAPYNPLRVPYTSVEGFVSGGNPAVPKREPVQNNQGVRQKEPYENMSVVSYNPYEKNSSYRAYDKNGEKYKPVRGSSGRVRGHGSRGQKNREYDLESVSSASTVSVNTVFDDSRKHRCVQYLHHIKGCHYCREKLRRMNGSCKNNDVLLFIAMGVLIIFIMDMFVRIGKRMA